MLTNRNHEILRFFNHCTSDLESCSLEGPTGMGHHFSSLSRSGLDVSVYTLRFWLRGAGSIIFHLAAANCGVEALRVEDLPIDQLMKLNAFEYI